MFIRKWKRLWSFAPIRPIQKGMTCINPRAPAFDTAYFLNPLST